MAMAVEVNEKMYTPDEVAEALGVSVQMVRRLCKNGGLGNVKLGYNRVRISQSDLTAFMEQRYRPAKGQ